jgi:flagellar FliL protein
LLLPCWCSVAAALVRSSSCTRARLTKKSARTPAKASKPTPRTRRRKGQGKGKKDKKGKAAEPKLPGDLRRIQPPFVVNFDAKGVMRFLQVSMQVMTRDHETSELIKLHDPKIRNNMLLLLGVADLDTISTMEAKEELRKKALETIAKIVEDEGGEGKKVEDSYFTSFVMQ